MLYGGIDGLNVSSGGGGSLGIAGALMMDPLTHASQPTTALTITAPITTARPAGSTVGGGGLALSGATTGALSYAAQGAAAAPAMTEAEATALLGALTVLAEESRRQAALGRDLFGRPLGGSEDHAFEQRVLELVNAERARAGLGPVSYDRQLDAASEGHNRQQINMRAMAHSGIGDGTPEARVRATGFTGGWGENVATGQTSPEQVVREWMASPSHRRNILDPSFSRMGVAYGAAADGRTYWAQTFGT